MSFFRRFRQTRETDEERKARLLKKEREHDRKKREDFLNKRDAAAELKDSSLVDNNPTTAEHDGPTIDESGTFAKVGKPKRTIRERLEDYKIKRSGDKEERELKKFKSRQFKEEREEKERKARERKIFGHELSEQERAEIQEAKEAAQEEKERKKIERTKKAKESYTKFSNTLGAINKHRGKLAGIGIDFGQGLSVSATSKGSSKRGRGGGGATSSAPMGNLDLVNVFSQKKEVQSQKLANDMISFDLNFGNLVAGKKANKKPGKHPLSI